jgi:hypothetical protein
MAAKAKDGYCVEGLTNSEISRNKSMTGRSLYLDIPKHSQFLALKRCNVAEAMQTS